MMSFIPVRYSLSFFEVISPAWNVEIYGFLRKQLTPATTLIA